MSHVSTADYSIPQRYKNWNLKRCKHIVLPQFVAEIAASVNGP